MNPVQVYEGEGVRKHSCVHIPRLVLACQSFDYDHWSFVNSEKTNYNEPVVELSSMNRLSIQKLRDIEEFLQEKTNATYFEELVVFRVHNSRKKRKEIHRSTGQWEILSFSWSQPNCCVFDFIDRAHDVRSQPIEEADPFWENWKDVRAEVRERALFHQRLIRRYAKQPINSRYFSTVKLSDLAKITLAKITGPGVRGGRTP